MPTERSQISRELLDLTPSDTLESISSSHLVREGPSVLQKVLETAPAVLLNFPDQDAMAIMSERRYNAIVALLHRIQKEQSDGYVRKDSK